MGTTIEKIKERAIINTEMNDIFVGGTNQLRLLGTSHHTKECMEWILWKNGVDIQKYAKYIMKSPRQKRKEKMKYSMIINTRWSSTNFYHWMHECLPRLSCYTQREELAQNTQYIWAGSATPKRYHIETMEALGIDIKSIEHCKGIIETNNLVNATFCHRSAFHEKQIEECRRVMDKIDSESENSKYVQKISTSKKK